MGWALIAGLLRAFNTLMCTVNSQEGDCTKKKNFFPFYLLPFPEQILTQEKSSQRSLGVDQVWSWSKEVIDGIRFSKTGFTLASRSGRRNQGPQTVCEAASSPQTSCLTIQGVHSLGKAGLALLFPSSLFRFLPCPLLTVPAVEHMVSQ